LRVIAGARAFQTHLLRSGRKAVLTHSHTHTHLQTFVFFCPSSTLKCTVTIQNLHLDNTMVKRDIFFLQNPRGEIRKYQLRGVKKKNPSQQLQYCGKKKYVDFCQSFGGISVELVMMMMISVSSIHFLFLFASLVASQRAAFFLSSS